MCLCLVNHQNIQNSPKWPGQSLEKDIYGDLRFFYWQRKSKQLVKKAEVGFGGDFNKQQTQQRNCIKISVGDIYMCKCEVLNAF